MTWFPFGLRPVFREKFSKDFREVVWVYRDRVQGKIAGHVLHEFWDFSRRHTELGHSFQ